MKQVLENQEIIQILERIMFEMEWYEQIQRDVEEGEEYEKCEDKIYVLGIKYRYYKSLIK